MPVQAIALLDHDEGHGFARWALAATIVLATHIGLISIYFYLRDTQSQGSPQAPAVIVDLAPLESVAPAVQEQDLAPGPETPPPEPEMVEPPKPPDPVIEPIPEEKPVVALPEPKPEVKHETEDQVIQKPRDETPRVQTAPPKAAQVGSAAATPNFGNNAANVVPPTWITRLVAHLNRYKRYPKDAQERREVGVVKLNFTMDREGHILTSSIAKSSGSAALDAEVLDMLHRAEPLPAFPPSMQGPNRSFSLPIRFSAR